ncbi:MAG TPA: sigma-70 family RNA polymerase sigma factor [Frankiaceae bacterium]|nr:sigma-70 family RNA polymerase sigma factor [Frankiaceae bacterium]
MDPRADAPDADLAAFYAQSYARLVGVVGAIAQDRDAAEEAVQDAFVRLLGQWSRVAAYDDPEAWVRKVALGFVSNRRRKLRNDLRALARLSPPSDQPPPGVDGVDLRRALAALPRDQRAVVVLQETGLPLVAIADQLGVPVGTVKSRLSRARATLAPLLREEADRV